MRKFACRICGAVAASETRTGPLRSVCDTCDPDAAAARRRGREWTRARARRRASHVAELEARVDLLEEQLREASAAQHVPGADRAAVARAVRLVGLATGREGTRRALLHLRDVASSWAAELGVTHETDPPAVIE